MDIAGIAGLFGGKSRNRREIVFWEQYLEGGEVLWWGSWCRKRVVKVRSLCEVSGRAHVRARTSRIEGVRGSPMNVLKREQSPARLAFDESLINIVDFGVPEWTKRKLGMAFSEL